MHHQSSHLPPIKLHPAQAILVVPQTHFLTTTNSLHNHEPRHDRRAPHESQLGGGSRSAGDDVLRDRSPSPRDTRGSDRPRPLGPRRADVRHSIAHRKALWVSLSRRIHAGQPYGQPLYTLRPARTLQRVGHAVTPSFWSRQLQRARLVSDSWIRSEYRTHDPDQLHCHSVSRATLDSSRSRPRTSPLRDTTLPRLGEFHSLLCTLYGDLEVPVGPTCHVASARRLGDWLWHRFARRNQLLYPVDGCLRDTARDCLDANVRGAEPDCHSLGRSTAQSRDLAWLVGVEGCHAVAALQGLLGECVGSIRDVRKTLSLTL